MKQPLMSAVMAVAMVTVFGVPSPVSSAAQDATTSWISPQFGFGVAWQDPWRKEAEASVAGRYDMLRLAAGDIPYFKEFWGIAWTERDPGINSVRFVREFRADAKDLVVIQEWAPEGARGQPMTIEFTGADGVRFTEWIYASPMNVFGSRDGVYVYAASRPSDYRNPAELRQLTDLVQVSRLSRSGESVSSPSPTPSSPQDRLISSLSNMPFLSTELPPLPPDAFAFRVAESDSHPLLGSGPNRVVFRVEFGRPPSFAGIAYWVNEDAAAARRERDAHIERLQQGGIPLVGGVTFFAGQDFGYDTVRLKLGTITAYYVLVANVVVVALVNHPVIADSYAYDLAEAAIAHLLRVKASL